MYITFGLKKKIKINIIVVCLHWKYTTGNIKKKKLTIEFDEKIQG